MRRQLSTLAAAAALMVAVTAAPAQAGPGWAELPGFTATGASTLAGVTAFSPTDAWAVGGQDGGRSSLTAHWDGRAWQAVRSPGTGVLSDVAGTSRTDVWAVGGTPDGTTSVVQRWNGYAWSLVPHVAGTADSPLTLAAVDAVTRTDAWAVGFRGGLDASVGHTQHWDGKAWREVPVPTPPGAFLTLLTSVAAAGPAAVWASGLALDENGFSPYFVRWNGVRWSLAAVPASITGGYHDLHVFGPDSIVAVGTAASAENPTPTPVAVTYTGGTWRQEFLPIGSAELNSVAPDGTGGLWVVGDVAGPDGEHGNPVILHRSAGATPLWTVADPPVTEPGHLRDVEIVPGTARALAVGHTGVTEDDDRHVVLGYRMTR